MDFNTIFVSVFITVYTLYLRYRKLFFKPPQQLFIFDNKTKQLFVSGYVGNTLIKIAINYFTLPGTYLIKANGVPMRCFIDGVLDNSDSDLTYVMGCNFIELQEDTHFDVTDNINDETVSIHKKKGEVIDYNKLILELFPDEI